MGLIVRPQFPGIYILDALRHIYSSQRAVTTPLLAWRDDTPEHVEVECASLRIRQSNHGVETPGAHPGPSASAPFRSPDCRPQRAFWGARIAAQVSAADGVHAAGKSGDAAVGDGPG
jgi:hypothetical protein